MSSGSDSESDTGPPAEEIPGFYYDRQKKRYFKIAPYSSVTNSVSSVSLEQQRAVKTLRRLNRSLRRLHRLDSTPPSIVHIIANLQSGGHHHAPHPYFSTRPYLSISYRGNSLDRLLKLGSCETSSCVFDNRIAFLTIRNGRAEVSSHQIIDRGGISLEERTAASIPHQTELGWGNGASPFCMITSPTSTRPLIAFTRSASVETGRSRIYTIQELDEGRAEVRSLEVGVQRRLQAMKFDRRSADRVVLGGGNTVVLYNLATEHVIMNNSLPNRSFVTSLEVKDTDMLYAASANGDLHQIDLREAWRPISCRYRGQGEQKINLLSVAHIPQDDSLLLHTYDGRIMLYDVRMRRQLHSVTSWCKDAIIKSALKLDHTRRYTAQGSKSGIITIYKTSTLSPIDVININHSDLHNFTEFDAQSNNSYWYELTSHIRPRLLIFNQNNSNPELSMRAC